MSHHEDTTAVVAASVSSAFTVGWNLALDAAGEVLRTRPSTVQTDLVTLDLMRQSVLSLKKRV